MIFINSNNKNNNKFYLENNIYDVYEDWVKNNRSVVYQISL